MACCCGGLDTDFMRDALKRLIACDTQTTVHDDSAVAKLLEDICKAFGMDVQVFPTKADPNKKNVVAHWGPGPYRFVLSSHFDTVPVGDVASWTHPPLEATTVKQSDGHTRVYGRGTSDMKGGLVSQLAVLKYLHDNNLEVRKDVLLVVSCQEEEGIRGAKDFVHQHGSLLSGAEVVVVDEPTNLDIGISEKGDLLVSVTCHGKAAHGSRPELGISAIEGVMLFIEWLHHALPYSVDPYNKTTLNVGTIVGGTSINVVPDKCTASLDIRISSFVTVQDIINKIQSIIDTLHQTTKFRFEWSEFGRMESVHTDPQHECVVALSRCVTKINGRCSIVKLAYGTDGAVFATVPQPPKIVIFGPGNPDVIHEADEWIDFDNIPKAANAMLCMIKAVNE